MYIKTYQTYLKFLYQWVLKNLPKCNDKIPPLVFLKKAINSTFSIYLYFYFAFLSTSTSQEKYRKKGHPYSKKKMLSILLAAWSCHLQQDQRPETPLIDAISGRPRRRRSVLMYGKYCGENISWSRPADKIMNTLWPIRSLYPRAPAMTI